MRNTIPAATVRQSLAIFALVFLMTADAHAGLVVLDLRANTGVWEAPSDPAENGDVVTEWRDQSGMGNHAVISNAFIGSTGPIFSSADPSIQFPQTVSGGQNTKRLQLSSALVTNTTYFKIKANVKTTGGNSDEIPILMNYGNANPRGFELMVYRDRFEFYVGYSLAPDPNNRLISPTFADGAYHEVEVERIGDAFTMRMDGTVVDTDVYPGFFTGFRPLTIGNGSDYNVTPVSGSILNDIASISVEIPEPVLAGLMLPLSVLMLVRRRHRDLTNS